MAAEIKRSDIIEDAAVRAPLEFAANLKVAIKQLDIFIGKQREAGGSAKTGNLTKLKEETQGLGKAQQELIKLQNQVATAQAKNNAAYLAQQKVMQDTNNELQNKEEIGVKDTKSV